MIKLFKPAIYVFTAIFEKLENELTVIVYVIANFNLANYLPTMQ